MVSHLRLSSAPLFSASPLLARSPPLPSLCSLDLLLASAPLVSTSPLLSLSSALPSLLLASSVGHPLMLSNFLCSPFSVPFFLPHGLTPSSSSFPSSPLLWLSSG
ncbi:unnamed protein product [Urochloa humidicola]